jgi:Predicted transcriptional regulators
MPDEIRLDDKMFEALSSETRRKILVSLDPRPLTVSELSRLAGKQKSAMYNHLQVLIEVGLVYRKESGNEFVFYDLTEKGRAIVNQHPKPGFRIFLALAVSAVSMLGGLVGTAMYCIAKIGLTLPIPGASPAPTVPPYPTPDPFPTSGPTVVPTQRPAPVPAPDLPHYMDIWLIISICLFLAGLFLLFYSLKKLKANAFQGFPFRSP